MVSEQQQRYRSDDGSSDDEVGGLTETKEIEAGDEGKFDDTQLLVKDAAATATAATMVLLPSAGSKEEGYDGNSSIQKASSILERKRLAFPASSFEFVPILKRAKVSAASSTKTEEWELTPVSILIRILGYLDNTTLMIMCLVCNQIKTIIWNGSGMEYQLVRVLELRPSDKHDNDRMQTFSDNMNRYVQDDTKRRMLQGYQHWKIHDLKRIIQYMADDNTLEKFAQNVRLNGIVSLDVSSPVPTTPLYHSPWPKFFCLISFVVPNLRHLDLSKTRMSITKPKHFITAISEHLPCLETIKWNDLPTCSQYDSRLSADGAGLESIRTLKEFYLDNNKFGSYSRIQNNGGNNDNDGDDNLLLNLFRNGGNNNDDGDDNLNLFRIHYPNLFRIHHPQLHLDDYDTNTASVPTEFEAMSDLNNHPHTFLFYKLCHKPLEGVSIRNLTACSPWVANYPLPQIQTALVKFVRNAPTTLKWFRSDLTQDNITMLQSERPGIKFLN